MPFVPCLKVAQIEIRMTADLQHVENTLYFHFVDAVTSIVLAEVGVAIHDWWVANLSPLMWSGVHLNEIVCTDLTSATGPQTTTASTVDDHGQIDDVPLPTNVSLAVSFRTANRGRSFRGRNYFVGIVEGQKSGANTVGDELITGLVDAYTALTDIASGFDATWVVVSRFHGVTSAGVPIPRSAGISTEIETVLVVDNVIDSQRRRLPGRGK